MLLLTVLLMHGCAGDRGTILPSIGPITECVYASGVVKAVGQYQVYPVVTGQVTALLVQEGDTVKAGTPLLHIDDRTSNAGRRSALAQVRLLEQSADEQGPVLSQLRETLAQSRERLLVDSTNYARQQVLWEQRIGSRSDLEQRELAYSNSRSAVTRATKALVETRDRLRTELELARNNATINTAGNTDRTPVSLIDGLVYDLLVETGELASPQKPLAIIGSATDLYLELEVDERDIALVRVGQKVAATVELYPDAIAATVSRIVPLMDPRTRTFTVEARFSGRTPRLYPNITAEANIVLAQKERALTIPASYLLQGDSVRTAPDVLTPVRIGLRDLERVEVLSGIDRNTELYRP
jgi:multidrug efflux pump subunit AcrA (membrane-fusion protein)